MIEDDSDFEMVDAGAEPARASSYRSLRKQPSRTAVGSSKTPAKKAVVQPINPNIRVEGTFLVFYLEGWVRSKADSPQFLRSNCASVIILRQSRYLLLSSNLPPRNMLSTFQTMMMRIFCRSRSAGRRISPTMMKISRLRKISMKTSLMRNPSRTNRTRMLRKRRKITRTKTNLLPQRRRRKRPRLPGKLSTMLPLSRHRRGMKIFISRLLIGLSRLCILAGSTSSRCQKRMISRPCRIWRTFSMIF